MNKQLIEKEESCMLTPNLLLGVVILISVTVTLLGCMSSML